jgi:hypothetical protein
VTTLGTVMSHPKNSPTSAQYFNLRSRPRHAPFNLELLTVARSVSPRWSTCVRSAAPANARAHRSASGGFRWGAFSGIRPRPLELGSLDYLCTPSSIAFTNSSTTATTR